MTRIKPTKLDFAKQITAALYGMYEALPADDHHHVKRLLRNKYGTLSDLAKTARKVLSHRNGTREQQHELAREGGASSVMRRELVRERIIR